MAGKVWEPGTLFKMTSDVDIQLWEYDPDTADDLLGQPAIAPSEVGQGNKTRDFTGDGGHYKFTYQVISH